MTATLSRMVVLTGLLLTAARPARATVYDPTGDFSITNGNPNGVWTYGWMDTSFTSFTPFTKVTMGSGGVNPQWYGWHTDSTPCLWLNKTTGTISDNPPGWLALHPGPGSEPAVLRWTAGTPGHCRAEGQFLAGASGTMLVGVRHNTNWLWQASNAGAFTSEVDVASGDVLDFVVCGGYAAGTTPLALTLDGPRPAVTRYVDAACTNATPPYTSWSTAANAIQDAVEISGDYDTVLVAAGNYAAGGAPAPDGTLINRVCITNLVTVRSAAGAAATSIQGAADARGVYLGGGGRLEGFTIDDGQTAPSGGLADSAGGGACVVSGTVARCILRDNAAATGGGIYLACGGTAENCLVVSNQCTGDGGGVAFAGGTLIHGTVADNVAGGGGGVCLDGGGYLRNSIVYSNSAAAGANWWATNGAFEAVCTTPTNSLPVAVNCVAADPEFVAPGSNYRLAKTSPCVDTTASPAGPTTDLAGMPRVADGDGDGLSALDLGCYERWERQPFIATLDENAQLYVAEWNAASNAFVNYRLIGAWRQNEGVSANSRGCAIADFNEDGHDDIVVGRQMFNHGLGYTLFLNDGTNGFVRQEAGMLGIMSEGWTQISTAGDFDHDGHADFIGQGDIDTIVFFKGDGTGHFRARAYDGFESRCRGLDHADFDGDGTNDLVRTSYSSGNLRYHRGRGDGSFGPYAQIADVGDDPYALVAGDFDLDGHPDVMVNAGSSGDVRFFKGLGSGAFASEVMVPSLDINRHSAMDAADFDADGDLDIVMSTYDGRSILFFRNNGDGTNYAASVTIGTTPNNVMCIAAPPLEAIAFAAPASPTGAPPSVAGATLYFGEAAATNATWLATLQGTNLAADADGDLDAFDWDSQDQCVETFDDGAMSHWRPLEGSWSVTTNLPLSGAALLRQSNTSPSRARILHDFPISGDFEMEADFQWRAGSGMECIFVLAASGYSDGYEVLLRGRDANDIRLDRAGTILNTAPLGFT
ncbi:MAG: VCBS repeat-containing protein, partial [Kiritimatiellae bacterium]|nr:VCBS repeat-containing protein [Kiritimatiellia bacterium]